MKVSTLSEKQIKTNIKRREKLLSDLNSMLLFCRGSLHKFRVKRKTKIDGESYRYYYNWERIINGKRVSRTVRLDQVEYIRAGIARFKAFKNWSREFENIMEKEYLSKTDWQNTDAQKNEKIKNILLQKMWRKNEKQRL